jgi:TfoX/Sxy family transcriptional regulator of competence genes
MSTSAATIDHILDCLSDLPLSARKMFGEYALYLDDRVVALVCDDRLFVKPTAGALALAPALPSAAPYSGAKDHLDATELLDAPNDAAAVLRAVARVLPPAKPDASRKDPR